MAIESFSWSSICGVDQAAAFVCNKGDDSNGSLVLERHRPSTKSEEGRISFNKAATSFSTSCHSLSITSLRSSLLILKLAFNRTGLEFNSRVIAHWSISCLTPPRDVCPILNAHNVRAMFRKSQVFAMCCPVQTQRSHPKRLSGRSGFSIPRSGLKADASL